MAFTAPETFLVGLLFLIGLVIGILSVLTMRLARKLDIKTYMVKSTLVGGFLFAVSEGFLLASFFSPYEIALPLHFILEILAIAAVLYGVVLYHTMLKAQVKSIQVHD